jgi:hypothetical protein
MFRRRRQWIGPRGAWFDGRAVIGGVTTAPFAIRFGLLPRCLQDRVFSNLESFQRALSLRINAGAVWWGNLQ